MFQNFLRFWSQEHSLTALLLVIVVDLLVVFPLTGGGKFVDLSADLVFSFILLAGLHSMARNKVLRILFSVSVVLGVTTHFAWKLFNLNFLAGWNSLFSALAVIGMLNVTLWMVYQDGPVTAHRIRGAIAAYLLISVLFAKAYLLINYLIPGAFNMALPVTPLLGEGGHAFYYFSIITLTTVGYGDITPVAPAARSLAMCEALIGQLYPAILIARLVTLEMEHLGAQQFQRTQELTAPLQQQRRIGSGKFDENLRVFPFALFRDRWIDGDAIFQFEATLSNFDRMLEQY